jgi:hypothetical protein
MDYSYTDFSLFPELDEDFWQSLESTPAGYFPDLGTSGSQFCKLNALSPPFPDWFAMGGTLAIQANSPSSSSGTMSSHASPGQGQAHSQAGTSSPNPMVLG